MLASIIALPSSEEHLRVGVQACCRFLRESAWANTAVCPGGNSDLARRPSTRPGLRASVRLLVSASSVTMSAVRVGAVRVLGRPGHPELGRRQREHVDVSPLRGRRLLERVVRRRRGVRAGRFGSRIGGCRRRRRRGSGRTAAASASGRSTLFHWLLSRVSRTRWCRRSRLVASWLEPSSWRKSSTALAATLPTPAGVRGVGRVAGVVCRSRGSQSSGPGEVDLAGSEPMGGLRGEQVAGGNRSFSTRKAA